MIDTYLITRCHNLENHNFNTTMRTLGATKDCFILLLRKHTSDRKSQSATAVYQGAVPVV